MFALAVNVKRLLHAGESPTRTNTVSSRGSAAPQTVWSLQTEETHPYTHTHTRVHMTVTWWSCIREKWKRQCAALRKPPCVSNLKNDVCNLAPVIKISSHIILQMRKEQRLTMPCKQRKEISEWAGNESVCRSALKEQTETPAPPCRRTQKTHPAQHPPEEWREERRREEEPKHREEVKTRVMTAEESTEAWLILMTLH